MNVSRNGTDENMPET